MDRPLTSELPQFYRTFWNSEGLVQPELDLPDFGRFSFMISHFKITRKKDPCFTQGKVSLWGPFRFEIHKTSRPREVENLKGRHSGTFPIQSMALFLPVFFSFLFLGCSWTIKNWAIFSFVYLGCSLWIISSLDLDTFAFEIPEAGRSRELENPEGPQ